MVKIVYRIGTGLYLAYHGYTPECLLSEFEGDLDEMVYDLAWDSDTAPKQGRDMKRYQVVDETFGIFDSFAAYKANWSSMRYFRRYCQFELWSMELTNAQKRRIYTLYKEENFGEGLFAINKIMQVKKMRSKFRLSLKAQFLDWLSEDEPQFNAPLSHRQVNAANKYNSHDLYCIQGSRVSPLHF